MSDIVIQEGDSTATHVKQRFHAMCIPKTEVSNVWQEMLRLYYVYEPWLVNGETWTKPVRFPTLRDVVSALVDRFMQDPPDALIEAVDEKDKDAAIALKMYMDDIKNSIHEKKVRRQVLIDMFMYGKGFRGVMYHKLTRKYGKDEKCLFDNVATERIHPRDIFIDDAAYQLHDKLRLSGARDVIRRRVYPYSTFKDMFSEQDGFHISNVRPVSYFYTDDSYLITSDRENTEKSGVMAVKTYELMDQEQDWYAIVANGNTIFEGKLSECKGTTAIPVVDYTFEPRNDSVWGTSLGELLAPHILLRDTLINLEILNLKLTLQPVLAVSGEFGFNPKVHVLQPGGVWRAGSTLNGKVADHIEPIVSGNPNTNFYNFHQLIQGEMSVTSRSDIRNLEFQENKTATETIQQSRSMNAHTEQVESINEIEAEGVLVEIMLEIMKCYMGEKAGDTKKKKRMVHAEGYVVNQMEGSSPRFIEKSGAEGYFAMTEEVINTDVEVKVVDKRAKKAAELERVGRIMQALPLVGNMAQLDPAVLQKLDIIGLLEQLIESIGLDPEKSFKEDVMEYDDEFELLKEEIVLGNKMEVPPKETRKDARKRLKFLLEMRYDDKKKETKQWKEMSKESKEAWNYHLARTMDAIMRPQTEIQEEQAAIPPEMMNPAMAQQPVQQPIAQPDKGLLNVKQARPNQVV